MGNKKTFWKLIKEDKIRIPIIQRDYLQGSDNEKDKRNRFLDFLLDTDKEKNLNYIYGYKENGYFIPIDGQQRLTTLFLLHFYLAVRLNKDKEVFKHFKYELRTSSKDFLESLVKSDVRFEQTSPKEEIKNQLWFYSLWEKDDTVVSMLDMLDAIHSKLSNKDNEYLKKLWERLTEQNYIYFYIYDVKEYDFPEDVFIKMNSRGILLTPMEQFKAWLDKFIEDKKLQNEKDWKSKIDNQWLDFFWSLIPKEEQKNKEDIAEKTDRLFIGFINEMLFLFISAYSQKDSKDDIKKLIDEKHKVHFSIYEKHLTKEILERLFEILDKVSANKEEIDSKIENIWLFPDKQKNNNKEPEKIIEDYKWKAQFSDLLKEFIKGPKNYRQRAMFYAFALFLADNEINNNFKKYIRVLRNLVNNTNINGENISKVVADIELLFSLTKEDDFYKKLEHIDKEKITQFDEEKDKASLINKDSEWEELLLKAENHWYLAGQIDFLLDYSNKDKKEFDKYYRAFYTCFDKKEDKDFLLHRALLSIGDYLPWISGSRYTFCSFDTDLNRKRKHWRVVFKGYPTNENGEKTNYFKQLLDKIKDGKKLEEIIEENKNNWQSDWRWYFLEYPFLIDKTNACREIFYDESNIYLVISKCETGRKKADIYTLILYSEMMEDEDKNFKDFLDSLKIKIAPYIDDRRNPININSIPIDNEKYNLVIRFNDNGYFELVLYRPDGEEIMIQEKLNKLGFEYKKEHGYVKEIKFTYRGDLEEKIIDIKALKKQIENIIKELIE